MGSSEKQGALWGAEAREWAELQEHMCKPMWEGMLKAAGVTSGTRLLDAGCGTGGASVLASGRGAQVSGLDASEASIAITAERVPEGDFRAGDLEALPFEAGMFDAVIAPNSIQFAADTIAAIGELKRVCGAGGQVVVGIWGAPEDCEQRFIFEAVRNALPDPPEGAGPFTLSATGQLEALIERSGMKPIGGSEVKCPFEYLDTETFWRALHSSGPAQAAKQVIGEERLKEVLLKACEPFQSSTGAIRIENTMRYVAATP